MIGLTSVHTTMSTQYERRLGELETRCARQVGFTLHNYDDCMQDCMSQAALCACTQAETIKQLDTRRVMDHEGFQVSNCVLVGM